MRKQDNKKVNSGAIQKCENEEKYLKIQYAARVLYNRAECLNFLSWLFCILSFMVPLLMVNVSTTTRLGISFALCIAVWWCNKKVELFVKDAASCRNYFDSHVLGIQEKSSDDMSEKEILETSNFIFKKKNKKAMAQISNSGEANFPGVYDWYVFDRPYEGVEAQYEAQSQNIWWSKKLFCKTRRYKILVVLILSSCLAGYFFTKYGFLKSIFCMAPLLIKSYTWITNKKKELFVMGKITGLQQLSEKRKTSEMITELQMNINDLRKIPTPGINIVHIHYANTLSELYKSIKQEQQQ